MLVMVGKVNSTYADEVVMTLMVKFRNVGYGLEQRTKGIPLISPFAVWF